MVEHAPAEEGIREVLLGIARNDDDGAVLRPDRLVDLYDVEGHLVEHIKQVILEVRIRLVDLVDEQDRLLVRHECLADLAHLDVVLDGAHVALRVAEAAVVESGQRVVLVQGLHGLHAGLHVQNDERHGEVLGDGVSQQGLARAGLALDEQGHLEPDAGIDDLGQLRVEDVIVATGEFVGLHVISPEVDYSLLPIAHSAGGGNREEGGVLRSFPDLLNSIYFPSFRGKLIELSRLKTAVHSNLYNY